MTLLDLNMHQVHSQGGMMPHDLHYFSPTARSDWLAANDKWFTTLAATDVMSPAEKIHIARLAIQQQWICDVEDSEAKRQFLGQSDLSFVTTNGGYLIVTGSPILAQYDEFRSHKLSLVEVGILYGYSPTAVLAFAGFLPQASPQPWPETPAEYFLGGVYSRDHVVSERAVFEKQWVEIRRRAPDVCRLAERFYKNTDTTPEAFAEHMAA